MDPAWIGVIGIGIGSGLTLLGTWLTQRHADKARAADRDAEKQRWADERRAEHERWRRELDRAREDERRQQWIEKRSDVYLVYARAVLACLEHLRKGEPGPSDPWDALMASTTELLIIGGHELRDAAATLTRVLNRTRVEVADSPERAAAVAVEAGDHMTDVFELIRSEIGIIPPVDGRGDQGAR